MKKKEIFETDDLRIAVEHCEELKSANNVMVSISDGLSSANSRFGDRRTVFWISEQETRDIARLLVAAIGGGQ